MYDEHLAVAAALDAFQCEKPLAEAMTAAAMPSDDEVDAVLKLCGWLSDTRHDAERQRQIRSDFRRTVHEAFRLGVEAARRPQPEPHTAMPDFWSVDVHVDAERLVSIGHNWLSGKELGQAEERAIIGAAQHLLAFVGFGLPRPDFDPDADEAAAHGAVTGELAAHQPSASSAAARPSAELADYHGPDDTPHPVLLALSEHDNPCESTAEAIARIAALHAEIDFLRPFLLRAQAQEEAKTDKLAAEYWREQARATACVTSMADAQSDDYAAQKLAESKGYPWGSLTEHGRSLMRRLAQSASIAAAPQPPAEARELACDFETWREREYPWLGPIGDGAAIAREAWNAALAIGSAPPRTEPLSKQAGAPVAHRMLRKNGYGEWVHDAKHWADGPAPAELFRDCAKHPNLYRIECAYAAPLAKSERDG